MATKKAKPKPPQARKASPQRRAKPARVAAAKKQPSKQQRPPAPSTRVATRPAAAIPLRSATPSSQLLSGAPSRSSQAPSSGSPTDGGVRYLTVQDLVDLHRAVSAEFGGTQAHPGVVESQFGLINAVQRPQVTTLGREAYPSFPEKVAAFLFALLTYSPFRSEEHTS